jgi:multiple sugar transport system permease protein
MMNNSSFLKRWNTGDFILFGSVFLLVIGFFSPWFNVGSDFKDGPFSGTGWGTFLSNNYRFGDFRTSSVAFMTVAVVFAAGLVIWLAFRPKMSRSISHLAISAAFIGLLYFITYFWLNRDHLGDAFGVSRFGFWLCFAGTIGLFVQLSFKRPQIELVEDSLYLWIAPWLIGFLLWRAWPMVDSFYLAFTNYELANSPDFTGFANIKKLINDDHFWQSLKVTFLYVLGTVPIGTSLALAAAMVLAQKLRGVNWWRTIYFMPSVVAGVTVAVMWAFIFNPDFGLLNEILSWFGIKGPGWLSDENWALPSVIVMGWWTGIGTQMVIYLAGLKGIPQSLYEAAEIDGAGQWAKFRNVTIPMLSPTILFNVIIQLIGAFRVIDPALVLTDGGPNGATRFYVFNLYETAFEFTKMGYASLLAWVLFIIVMFFTFLTLRISDDKVYYESEV